MSAQPGSRVISLDRRIPARCSGPGPTGRRAGLVAGPEDDLLALVAENTGVPARLIRVAVRYWASYPDEINAEIAAAQQPTRL
jgi:hypothetical protein